MNGMTFPCINYCSEFAENEIIDVFLVDCIPELQTIFKQLLPCLKYSWLIQKSSPLQVLKIAQATVKLYYYVVLERFEPSYFMDRPCYTLVENSDNY